MMSENYVIELLLERAGRVGIDVDALDGELTLFQVEEMVIALEGVKE